MTVGFSESETLGTVKDGASDTDLAAAKKPETIGQVLREARIARGLDLDEVADVLRFSVRQIEHLENNNFQALPGATLVRGFIRGYAKYLRLNPEVLLANLDTTIPPETSDVRPPTRIGEATKAGAASAFESRRTAVMALAIIGLLALIYVFVQMDQQPLAEVVAVLPAESSVVSPIAVPVSSSEVNTSATAGVQSPAGDSLPASTTPAQDLVPAVSDLAPADNVSSVEPGIVVEFDDLSWIEVRDADKNIVLVGEFPKGTKRVVQGKAPFSLWVGRASVVRLAYRGRTIDLKSGSREDVARLTIE